MGAAEFFTSLEIGLIYGIIAMGIYLTFRVLDFPDLTVDGSFVTGAATCAIVLKAGMDPLWALALSMLMGSMAGLITGVLYAYCSITNLLAGILTAFMLYSMNLRIMGGIPNLALFQEPSLLNAYPLGILLLISMLIWLTLSYVLTTDWGISLRAMGQNPKLSATYGIRPKSITIIGLMLSNGLVGLGGGLFCQHQGFADISQGIGTVIIGLAAVMIGERLLPFRSPLMALLSCILGSITYRLIIAMALHNESLGLNSADLNLITGLIIVMIMVLPKMQKRWTKC